MATTNIETRQAWAAALLRVAVGVIFAAHGAQKLFVVTPDGLVGFFGTIGLPLPTFNAYFVIAVEVLGGIAMIAGLGTRIVAALFAAVMVVAIATVHGPQGFFLPQGYEFNLVLLAASISLVLQGAGAFALDRVVSERRLTTREVSPVRA